MKRAHVRFPAAQILTAVYFQILSNPSEAPLIKIRSNNERNIESVIRHKIEII